MSFSGHRSRQSPEVEVYCTVDANGCFNTFSQSWNSHLAAQLEPVGLSSGNLQGRPLGDFLDDAARHHWHQGLRQLRANPQQPPHRLLPWDVFRLWPIPPQTEGSPSLRLSLGGDGLEDALSDLGRPWIQVDSRLQVRPVNRSAQAMLQAEPELADLEALHHGLAHRAQPHFLRRVPGLVIEGDSVWRAERLSLHADDGFQLATKVFRASLHDLSNPLAAVRMLTEAWSRGSADPGRYLPRMLDHLDTLGAGLRDLRQWLQADVRHSVFDAAGCFQDAEKLLHTELDRRELTLDLSALTSPESELEGPKRAFGLLASGLLLHTTGNAAAGDRLILSSSLDEEHWCLEGRIDPGSSPRPWLADPDLPPSLIRRLAAPFKGHFHHRLGEPCQWCLEIPLH